MLVHLTGRCVFVVRNADEALVILNGLVTNELRALGDRGVVYTAMLNSQGRFMADLFVYRAGESLYIDIAESFVNFFLGQIAIYDIDAIMRPTKTELNVVFSSAKIDGCQSFADVRAEGFGYRNLVAPSDLSKLSLQSADTYTARRVDFVIPDGDMDLEVGRSIILEYDFERLNAISFTKGCYMGQELMAITKHRGVVRKHLVKLSHTETLGAGEDIVRKLSETSNGEMCMALVRIKSHETAG